ncbi:MAG: ribonuclease D [Porticoccaceae bacterium]|nr:MAG: ribonuclease D [Porticoccaceae bacterium]
MLNTTILNTTMPNTEETSLPVPVLVTSTDQLQDCIEQLKGCDAVALDTEFMRTDTFFPILGLIQVYNGETCWLIDPIAISDLSPLTETLTDPNIIKVFHSCSEDLEVLKHVLGCVPEPLFDSQVAAALSGYGFSKGYASLVDVMLGIHVAKGETRSDWLRRPLSESQLGYAALDVIHLLPVYRRLCKNLSQLGRSEWVEQEMAAMIAKASGKDDLNAYFLKVKGAWQLDPQGLATLQLLCEWREAEARDRNRPRGRVIGDKTLLEIVLKKPKGKQSLAEIEGMHPGVIRRYADRIFELLELGLATPVIDCPKPLPEPLPRHAGNIIKQLKKVVTAQAELLDLPPEVLARKRDVEALVRYFLEQKQVRLPDSIAQGWRYDAVGKQLKQAVEALNG